MQVRSKNGEAKALALVAMLFFAWGFVTSNNDPLIAAMRSIYKLDNFEAQITQFAFFAGYGLFSLPASALLARFGASRSIPAALGLMVVACLVVPVASYFQTYLLVLIALFVMAMGITTLQVAANPLAAALGPPERSHFRLILAQAINSLGVVIGVYVGSELLLSGATFRKGYVFDSFAKRATALAAVDRAFLTIAGFLAGLLMLIWLSRRTIEAAAPRIDKIEAPLRALRAPWAVFGSLAIFVYVGAEVSIGSIMILFISRPEVLNLSLEAAGHYLGWIYWTGALVGRFIGAALLTRIRATYLLAFCATMATMLSLVAFAANGPIGGYAALAIGLFNSIMFPAIFTLTLERSSATPAATSGLLCFAITGGGIVPLLVGKVADMSSIPTAFIVPALAYVVIAAFAIAATGARPVAAPLPDILAR